MSWRFGRKPTVSAPNESRRTSAERARLRQRLKEGARQIFVLAVDALPLVASMTESVPYLGAVSSALTKIMAVQSEVKVFKSEWREAMNDIQKLQTIIDEVKDSRDASDELSLQERNMFNDLETTLENVLASLKTCDAFPEATKNRVKVYFNRADLSDMVKKSRQDIQSAVESFKIKLLIKQSDDVRALTSNFAQIQPGLQARMQGEERSNEGSARSTRPVLPPRPSIFYGRQPELDHIIKLMTRNSPTNIAILGPGGIGKTTVALAALHHPSLSEMYSHERFFISCETFSTASDLAFGMLKAMGLALRSSSDDSPVNPLLSFLKPLTVVVCLDNLESPWERDSSSVESLLMQLASIPGLSLLVTLRGTSRPLGISWTKPSLPPIRQLTPDAALNIWNEICGSHDSFAGKLVDAVGRLPLAVFILAHLAQSKTCEALWVRWNMEKVELVRRTNQDQHRLSSLAISIELSLTSTRMASEPTAIRFLGLLYTLPQGIPEARLSVFEKVFAGDLPRMRACITVLKQCALVSSHDAFLCVLPTIREYINSRHPLPLSLRLHLTDIYCALVVDDVPDDESARTTFLKATVTPELENIRSALTLSLSDDVPYSDAARLLRAAMEMTWLYGELSLQNFTLLDKALGFAYTRYPSLISQILRQRAQHLLFVDVEEAAGTFENALIQDREFDDALGQAEDYHGMGIAHIRRKTEQSAIKYLDLAYQLHVAAGDALGQAYDLKALAVAHTLAGDRDIAREALEKALELHEGFGDSIGQANSLNSLGVLHLQLGHHAAAEEVLLSALRLHEGVGARLSQANDLCTLSDLYVRTDRLEQAEEAGRRALELHQEVSDRLGQASDLRVLAEIHRQRGRLGDAEESLRTALSLSSDIGDRLGEASAHADLDNLYRRERRYDKALHESTLQHQLEPTERTQFGAGPMLDLKLLGKLYYRVGVLDPVQTARVYSAFGRPTIVEKS